jgi:hypothetical protein
MHVKVLPGLSVFLRLAAAHTILLRCDLRDLIHAGMITEGTVPVPHTSPALSDDEVVPVRGFYRIGSRGHSGGGGTPLSGYLVIEHFNRVLFEYHTFNQIVS